MIQRYDFFIGDKYDPARHDLMTKSDNGRFVLYTDHLAALAEKDVIHMAKLEDKSSQIRYWQDKYDYEVELRKKSATLEAAIHKLSGRQADEIARLNKYQAVCHCGAYVKDHGLQDGHTAVEMKEPCPFTEEIARLREALGKIYDYFTDHPELTNQTTVIERVIEIAQTALDQTKSEVKG